MEPGVEVLPSILEEVAVQRTSLLHALSQVWAQTFKWQEDCSPQNNTKTITLRVRWVLAVHLLRKDSLVATVSPGSGQSR